ncbi:MAG: hypothetical protein HOD58_01055 [Gammaproteobacteria bacterium]|jgi:hypothetical protein|nr:hypothetical protein [Gammaproteobacteria bacterium]
MENNGFKSFHEFLMDGMPVGDLVTIIEHEGVLFIDEYGRVLDVVAPDRLEFDLEIGHIDPISAEKKRGILSAAMDCLRQLHKALEKESLSYEGAYKNKIADESDKELFSSYGWYGNAKGKRKLRAKIPEADEDDAGESLLKTADPAQLRMLVKRLEKENAQLKDDLEKANPLDIFQDVDEALHATELQVAIQVYKEAVSVCNLGGGKKSMPGNKTPRNWMIERATEILNELRRAQMDSAVKRGDIGLEEKLVKRIDVDGINIATVCNWDREQINTK